MNKSTFNSSNGICHGTITSDGWNIRVQGVCKVHASKLRYAAAAPPDLRMSYMGSGLPFPNEQVAYEGSPNVGEAPLDSGEFSFDITNPNYYYKNNGSVLVQPHIMFTIGDQYFDVPIPKDMLMDLPNRSLTSMPGRSVRVTGR